MGAPNDPLIVGATPQTATWAAHSVGSAFSLVPLAGLAALMTFDPDKRERARPLALAPTGVRLARMATVDCQRLERDLELAKLETAFWESCQAVRASSAALHKIHGFLMEEMLELESDKRRSLSRRVEAMELAVAEMKVSLSLPDPLKLSLSLSLSHTHTHTHTHTVCLTVRWPGKRR